MDRTALMTLAATEYDRFATLAGELEPGEWKEATDCSEWDVKAMGAHVLGSMKASASIRENVRQLRATSRRRKQLGGPMVDALSAVQVEKNIDLTTDDLVAQLHAFGPRAAKGRKRTPAPLRRLVRIDVDIPGIKERWNLGHLVDTVLTRDTWMHRIDICQATGRDPVLTADHDGCLVADVVAEWARRHGQPYSLVLDGPAGGSFSAGGNAEEIRLDAVEFCRITSGRATGTGLLTQKVAF